MAALPPRHGHHQRGWEALPLLLPASPLTESPTGCEQGCTRLGSVLDPDPPLPAHSLDLAP